MSDRAFQAADIYNATGDIVLTEWVASLEAEVERLRAKVSTCTSVIAEDRDTIQALQAEVERLREEVETLDANANRNHALWGQSMVRLTEERDAAVAALERIARHEPENAGTGPSPYTIARQALSPENGL